MKSEASTVTVAVKSVPAVDFALSFQVMIVLLASEPTRVMNGFSAGTVTFSLQEIHKMTSVLPHYLVLQTNKVINL